MVELSTDKNENKKNFSNNDPQPGNSPTNEPAAPDNDDSKDNQDNQ